MNSFRRVSSGISAENEEISHTRPAQTYEGKRIGPQLGLSSSPVRGIIHRYATYLPNTLGDSDGGDADRVARCGRFADCKLLLRSTLHHLETRTRNRGSLVLRAERLQRRQIVLPVSVAGMRRSSQFLVLSGIRRGRLLQRVRQLRPAGAPLVDYSDSSQRCFRPTGHRRPRRCGGSDPAAQTRCERTFRSDLSCTPQARAALRLADLGTAALGTLSVSPGCGFSRNTLSVLRFRPDAAAQSPSASAFQTNGEFS